MEGRVKYMLVKVVIQRETSQRGRQNARDGRERRRDLMQRTQMVHGSNGVPNNSRQQRQFGCL
jgi:hypothetical protein